jgi:hypothetical protein
VAKRGRGRPRKLRPTASKESYAYAKQISKEYIEMKALVNVVERRMNTLALMVKKKSIRGYPIPLGVDEDLAECVLDENNRNTLVKKGEWQSTKLIEGEYALFSTVMSPHYEQSMYHSPTKELLEKCPELADYTKL